MRRLLPLLVFACAPPAPHSPPASPAAPVAPVLEPQTSGTTALLQAVSPVSETVVWVSGHRGTFARTTDGGRTWETGRVPDADTLQFRDVHAVSASTAYLLSAGTGALSRIYKTIDGGRTWALQHVNDEAQGFYDCLTFWDAETGVVYGDAVGGRLTVLRTENGGRTWTRVPADQLPPALANEGGFAASGHCVTAGPDVLGWIAAGNAPTARVLRTIDRGRSWSAAPTPLVAGDAKGGTTVAFRDGVHGVVLGGDIGSRDARGDAVALSDDGGRTWRPGGRPRIAGAIYGGAWAGGEAAPMLVAVGPGGADLSRDGGITWTALDSAAYWSVAFAGRTGWMVGPNGRITRVRLR
jgi:photosystem II stability/assembly factor-like uncharacterized protein